MLLVQDIRQRETQLDPCPCLAECRHLGTERPAEWLRGKSGPPPFQCSVRFGAPGCLLRHGLASTDSDEAKLC